MADRGARGPIGRVFDRIASRLDRIFKPFVSGAQVSPYVDRPAPPTARWTCPDCGQPFKAHRMDESARGRMYCPPAGP